MTFRVAIVNDLAMAREALRRVVLQVPGTEVAWTANDGSEAVACARSDRPDLVLMDLIMPVMDGVDATRRIMAESPCPIVVVTATVEGNASRVYEAIGAGALDAVDTPRLGSEGTKGDRPLLEKIDAVRRMRAEEGAAPRTASAATAGRAAAAVPPAEGPDVTCPIVAVGASTGGPQALATLLAGLPDPLPFAVVIVQHMDAGFLPGLARWLGGQSGRTVRLARRGDRPDAGAILVAGEPLQMVMRGDGTLDYEFGDVDLVHRPSVDSLFASLALTRARRGAAVLLTGMGRDGAAGMLAMREAGWRTFAQDRATSIVWGMPGAAAALGAAEAILPLARLGGAVTEALRPPAKGTRP